MKRLERLSFPSRDDSFPKGALSVTSGGHSEETFTMRDGGSVWNYSYKHYGFCFFLMSSFFLVGWAGGGIGLVGNKRSEGR